MNELTGCYKGLVSRHEILGDIGLDLDGLKRLRERKDSINKRSLLFSIVLFLITSFITISWQNSSWGIVYSEFTSFIVGSLYYSWLIVSILAAVLSWFVSVFFIPSFKNISLYEEKLEKVIESKASEVLSVLLSDSEEEAQRNDRGYAEAALYRSAWRKVVVIRSLLREEGVEYDQLVFKKIESKLVSLYDSVAPENAYGKVRLSISPRQFKKIALKLTAFPESKKSNKPCIYYGVSSEGHYYIGQTSNSYHARLAQHLKGRTGPFKNGNTEVRCGILDKDCLNSELNSKESYYIGLYNSYEQGLNDNRGLSLVSYERGCKDRQLTRENLI